MTITTSTSSSGPYTGAGTTGPFTVGFRFLADSHLKVIKKTIATGAEQTLVPTTDYTVTGAGSQSGGTVTLTVALTSSFTLTIQRNVPYTQETDYTQSDPFPAQSHEDALDKLTMLAQQLKVATDSSIRVPETASALPTVAVAATRASKMLGFDANGDPTVLVPASGSAADVLVQLANTATTTEGDALVGVKRTETGATATTLHAWIQRRPFYASDFGALFDGVTDDTAAILACMTALYAAGGGTMVLPRGTAVVNDLVFTYTDNNKTLSIRGQGKGTTILRKSNGAATPVLTLESAAGSTIRSTFSDFRVTGNAKAGPGIRLTKISMFDLRDLHVTACSTAVDALGALTWSAYDCDLTENAAGWKTRLSGAFRCNNIAIHGGRVQLNTGYGFDIGDASSFNVYDTDIEQNGTLADTATGDVIIRDTVDDETTTSQIGFYRTWHEANTGKGFTAQACAGLRLTLDGIRFNNNASGNDANIGVIARLVTNNILSNGTFNVAAVTTFTADACSWATLNNSAATYVITNSASNAGGLALSISVGALGSLGINATTGLVTVGAAGLTSTGDVTVKGGNTLLTTGSALVNASAANTATLTNAPLAGNPSKWIQINDNGTTRYIATWG